MMRSGSSFSDERCQPFCLAGGAHGVLLLHGFTGSAAHMRPLGERLHAQGFTVKAINLPGHAATMEDLAKTAWDDWLNVSKEAFQQLKQTCSNVSVAGLSMGGCLALLLAEQMQPTAIATISAPMGTRAPLWLASLLSPVKKTIWWRDREDRYAFDKQYDYSYPGFPTVCARQLSRLIRMARCDLHAVACPVLVIQSRADETITADSADVILRGVSSPRKAALWLADAPHVCTLSPHMDVAAQAIARHFRAAEAEDHPE